MKEILTSTQNINDKSSNGNHQVAYFTILNGGRDEPWSPTFWMNLTHKMREGTFNFTVHLKIR